MKIKYKLREEKKGASLFDNEAGVIGILNEEEYQEILHNNTKKFGYLFNNGKPLFKLFKSTSRKNLPSDCMSAPSKVYIELTRKCNLKCKNCYNQSSQALKNEISTEKILETIKKLSDIGCFELRFTGGEPTTHLDFFKIVNYAKDLGFFISMNSNGIWNEELTRKIKSLKFNTIIISLDGPQKINDSIRGPGTFDKIINTIKSLREDKNLTLKMNTTLGKYNKDYIEEIVSLANLLGIDSLNMAPLRLTGRAEQNKTSILSPAEIFKAVYQITNLRKKYKLKIQTYFDILDQSCSSNYPSSLINRTSCAAGIEVAAVNPNGAVYGCVVSPASNIEDTEGKRLFTAGNINDGDFLELWHNSEKWQAYRNLDLNKSENCKKCDFYSKSCFGNCPVTSYVHSHKLNAPDPYCFKELLK